MHKAHISISLNAVAPQVRTEAASALFGMAAAQAGASVMDIQLGDIALLELIETLDQCGDLETLRLDKFSGGFELILTYAQGCHVDDLPEGARQVIDAGLVSWKLTENQAVIALSPSAYIADHD